MFSRLLNRLLIVLVIIALSWLAVSVVAMLTGSTDALPRNRCGLGRPDRQVGHPAPARPDRLIDALRGVADIATPRSVGTMEDQEGISGRVADSIPATLTQSRVAARIGLTDEELSESLRDRRAWSTVELVKLAEVLKVDVYWLITGHPDPHRLIFTARHDLDHAPTFTTRPGPEG